MMAEGERRWGVEGSHGSALERENQIRGLQQMWLRGLYLALAMTRSHKSTKSEDGKKGMGITGTSKFYSRGVVETKS